MTSLSCGLVWADWAAGGVCAAVGPANNCVDAATAAIASSSAILAARIRRRLDLKEKLTAKPINHPLVAAAHTRQTCNRRFRATTPPRRRGGSLLRRDR